MSPDVRVWLDEPISRSDIYLHGASEVVAARRSPFQDVCIVDTPVFGRKLFLDGIVQSSESDEFIYHEVIVHPAMLCVGDPKRVLVLGGGEGATLREALRWTTVEHVVMVDIDADVVELAREHLGAWHAGSFDDPRAEVLHTDAVGYLQSVTEKFDVVISDMTDPVVDGPSVFCFTKEFFAAVAAALAPGGVLALQAGPLVPAQIEAHARVVRTLRSVFADARSYPCNAPVYGRPLGFALASDTPLMERLAPTRTAPFLTQVTGDLRYIDAGVAHGLVQTPPFIEAAIAASDEIYTDDAPPSAHDPDWT